MSLGIIEWWVREVGAGSALVCLLAALAGMARGLRRPRGRTTGLARKVLRLPAYLLISVLFFSPCFLLWRPLPLMLSAAARAVALILGALLFFPGLALYLWARLTLGEMYNVSSSMGAQLYADHRLVTRGPFALVRHPMYLGIILASAGGLLIYRTWTLVFTTVTFLGLVLRARREEQALAAEFAEQWEAYRQRVPGWIPRILGRR
ncbi:MAG: isoprenylcysteine carboxylmethyltransferase family protein [Chloroflexi bacterium]|nr:isoprenylcysteine carboxylmethyltransferase family protein [Chloroflexota bacterium]